MKRCLANRQRRGTSRWLSHRGVRRGSVQAAFAHTRPSRELGCLCERVGTASRRPESRFAPSITRTSGRRRSRRYLLIVGGGTRKTCISAGTGCCRDRRSGAGVACARRRAPGRTSGPTIRTRRNAGRRSRRLDASRLPFQSIRTAPPRSRVHFGEKRRERSRSYDDQSVDYGLRCRGGGCGPWSEMSSRRARRVVDVQDGRGNGLPGRC